MRDDIKAKRFIKDKNAEPINFQKIKQTSEKHVRLLFNLLECTCLCKKQNKKENLMLIRRQTRVQDGAQSSFSVICGPLDLLLVSSSTFKNIN